MLANSAYKEHRPGITNAELGPCWPTPERVGAGVCLSLCAYLSVFVCAYIRVCMRVCIHACMYVFVCTSLFVCA